MTTKFSQFTVGGLIRTSDVTVGLRGGINTQFTNGGIGDSAGNFIVSYSQPTGPGTAINYLDISSSFTGNPVEVSSKGLDANIGLILRGKGTTGFVIIDSVGCMVLPIGTTGQRPTGAAGRFRYNSTIDQLEYWSVVDAAWQPVAAGSSTISSIIGTANEIDIDNTDPANPIISLANPLIFPGDASLDNGNSLAFFDSTGVSYASFSAPAGGYTLSVDYSWPPRSPVSNGGILTSTTAGVITWTTATYPTTTTINQILYSSAANTITGLATANKAVLTTGATGIPVLTALAVDGQVIIGSTSGVPAAATLTAGTNIAIVNAGNSITISSTASGNTTTITQTSHGFSVDQALYLNGTVYTLAIATSVVTAEVVGIVSSVINANSFILSTAGRVTGLSGKTAGQVSFLSDSVAGLITTTEPTTLGNITKPIYVADTTTSAYLIPYRGKVIPSPSTSFSYIDQTGTSPTLSVAKGYICNAGASLISFALPATAALGDYYTIVGASSGGWKIQAGVGQIINVGSSATTSGGTVSSTNRYDSITIVCTTANTTWVTVGAPQGVPTTA